MLIKSLELCGYRRMRLNQIRKFKITPNQAIQLILGTNGSGKSSLVEELTPLPAIANNYTKDGYKIIELSNNGSSYILSSTFSSGQKHSFKKDGIELNEGRTITVQKELVRQEFGITAEIHDLITGIEKFHLMSPSRKREWFTQLGEADYDYSLKVFDNIKERYNHTRGAINISKKRLVIETAKLINPEEEKTYNAEVNELHKILMSLLEEREPGLRQEEDINAAYDIKLNKLNQAVSSLLKIRVIKPDDYSAESDTELEYVIWNLQQDVKNLETSIANKVDAFTSLEKSFEIMSKSGGKGLKELEERSAPIKKEQLSIRKQQKLGLVFNDPQATMHVVDVVEPQMFDLLSEMPDNKNSQYSKRVLEANENEIRRLTDLKAKLEVDYNRLNSQKVHLDVHKKEGLTVCPKCEHSWIRGYDEKHHNAMIAKLSEIEAEIAKVVLSIRSTEESNTFINNYAQRYREYNRTVQTTPLLNKFWDYVEQNNMLINDPKQILTSFGLLREDLTLEIRFKALEQEEAEISELSKAVSISESNNLEELTLKIEAASNEIGNLTRQLNDAKSKLASYTTFKSTTAKVLELDQSIKTLVADVEHMRDYKIKLLKNRCLSDCIREFQSTLAVKEKILADANIQRKLTEDLKDQISKLEKEEEALKLLIKNLSPTDGLIAEGLFGFIRNFVRRMNIMIKKTWSYPLEVITCGLNSDGGVELDYKFPLVVQSRDNQIPDVSKGSSGMREIVDLSFKITAMKDLGLSRAPIFLDEFGNSFDKAHRASAIEVIKSIMDQQSFSQLWMVSHDFGQYGALSNLETCVLSELNIVVPAVYNKHVVIE